MRTLRSPRALFIGLCTLDVIQRVDHVPATDEKLVADRQSVAAGGPATNAAVTFAHLGGAATLVTGVGRHQLTGGMRADLDRCRVRVVDLDPGRTAPPPVSSILVTAATGARAVVSTNAVADRLGVPADLDPLVRAADTIQVDGHHPRLALAALRAARAAGRPTLLDAGSWKPGTEELLPLLDVVACSADFHPPGARGPERTAAFLRSRGVEWIAITSGGGPVRWWGPDGHAGVVSVPALPVVDTLGAGDVFHGALTFGVAAAVAAGRGLDALRFTQLLAHAITVAGTACASFGTRDWMTAPAPSGVCMSRHPLRGRGSTPDTVGDRAEWGDDW